MYLYEFIHRMEIIGKKRQIYGVCRFRERFREVSGEQHVYSQPIGETQ